MASVVATGNNGYGTDINNTASTTNALVQIGGTNDFSGNGSTGLNVLSRGAITLSNIAANNSVNDTGAYLIQRLCRFKRGCNHYGQQQLQW